MNAMVRKSSHWLEFNQTHNAAMFSSKCETFALQIGYITLSFVGHSFRVEGEFLCGTFLCGTFCQFTIVNFHLISNIFLCRYASTTPRMKLLTWCRVISLAGLFGSGRARAWVCPNISGLHTKHFITLRVTTFFFRDVDFFYSPR